MPILNLDVDGGLNEIVGRGCTLVASSERESISGLLGLTLIDIEGNTSITKLEKGVIESRPLI